MAFFKAKVPAAIAIGIICLLVGGGLGAAIMSYTLGDPKATAAAGGGGGGDDTKADAKGGDAKGGKGGPGGGGGGGKGGGGGGKGGFGGGGKGGGGKGPSGPSSKTQLAQLVGKLDTLTNQSLHITLTPEQKKQAKEILADLTEKDAITEEEAKAKLDALVALLEPNKKTLVDAGFPAPPRGGDPPANPFKEGEGAERLKALRATLEK